MRKAITIESNVEEYYHSLARVYREISQFERAKYYFKKAAEKGFEQSVYWEDFIFFLIELKEYEKALETAKLADRYTYSYRLQYLNAAAFVGHGKIKDGLRMLEEVLDEAFEEHVVLLTLPTEISENKDIRSVISYFNE